MMVDNSVVVILSNSIQATSKTADNIVIISKGTRCFFLGTMPDDKQGCLRIAYSIAILTRSLS
jgi:hypothetical protein